MEKSTGEKPKTISIRSWKDLFTGQGAGGGVAGVRARTKDSRDKGERRRGLGKEKNGGPGEKEEKG